MQTIPLSPTIKHLNTAKTNIHNLLNFIKQNYQHHINCTEWDRLTTEYNKVESLFQYCETKTNHVTAEPHKLHIEVYTKAATAQFTEAEQLLQNYSPSSPGPSSQIPLVKPTTHSAQPFAKVCQFITQGNEHLKKAIKIIEKYDPSIAANQHTNVFQTESGPAGPVFNIYGNTTQPQFNINTSNSRINNCPRIQGSNEQMPQHAQQNRIHDIFKKHFSMPSMPSKYYLDFTFPASSHIQHTQHTDRTPQPSHEAKVKKCLFDHVDSLLQQSSSTTNKDVFMIGVWGQGGMGKSITLQAICYQQDIQHKFPDGIHFLALGEDATIGQLIQQLANCAGNAGFNMKKSSILELANQSHTHALNEAAQHCAEIFRRKRVLFVVDDVWNKQSVDNDPLKYVQTILHGTINGAVLFATREEKIVQQFATVSIHFDYLKYDGIISTKILLLHASIDDELHSKLTSEATDALQRLLKLCGGLKLCLAVAGAGLKKKLKRSISSSTTVNAHGSHIYVPEHTTVLSTVIQLYTDTLQRHNTMLSSEDTAPGYKNLVAVANSSLKYCEEWAQQNGLPHLCTEDKSFSYLFSAFSIGQPQQVLPESEVIRLWGLDEHECRRVVEQFASMNLISVHDETRGIRIHDRMIDVCNFLAKFVTKKLYTNSRRYHNWHRTLLNSYISQHQSACARQNPIENFDHLQVTEENLRDWWSINTVPVEAAEYILNNLSYHLIDAGLWCELMWLVSDVRWTVRRRNDGGWVKLDEDLERLLQAIDTIDTSVSQSEVVGNAQNSERTRTKEELKDGIELLRDTLRQSWKEIETDCHTIGFEIFSRIRVETADNYVVISRYMKTIKEYGPKPWLEPKTAFQQKEDMREKSRFRFDGRIDDMKMVKREDGSMQLNAASWRKGKRSRLTVHSNIGSYMYTKTSVKISEGISWLTSYCHKTNTVVVSSGLLNREMEVLHVESNKIIGCPLKGHKRRVTCAALSGDGQRVVSGSRDKTVRVWNVTTGKALGSPLISHKRYIKFVAFRGDGQRVVSVCEDNSIRVWDVATGTLISSHFMNDTHWVECVALSEDGQQVVFGSNDHTVRVWNLTTDKEVVSPLVGHERRVTCVGFSADGKQVVSGSEDGTVRVWDVRESTPVESLTFGHKDAVICVEFSGDGQLVVSGSSDRTARLWDTSTGKQIKSPLLHDNPVAYVSLHIDDQLLVSGSYDEVRLWDGRTGTQVTSSLINDNNYMTCVAFSRDKKLAVCGLLDGTIRIWNMSTRTIVGAAMIGHEKEVLCVEFSADRQRVVSGSRDKTVRVWDIAASELVGSPMIGHQSWVRCVSFSEDGQMVVSGSDFFDSTIRVWDVKTSTQIGPPLIGHTDLVSYVRFIRDGQLVVSASEDKTVRVWNRTSSRSLFKPLRYCQSSIYQMDQEEERCYKTWLQGILVELNNSNQFDTSLTCIHTLYQDIKPVFTDLQYDIDIPVQMTTECERNCVVLPEPSTVNANAVLKIDKGTVYGVKPNGDKAKLGYLSESKTNCLSRCQKKIVSGMENGRVIICQLQE